MPESPIKPFSGIFVSYRRDDSAGHAGWLSKLLVDHFGKDQIFMDVDSIDVGVDFEQVIENAVASCEILIVLIGRHWLSSTDGTQRRLDDPLDFVRLEITAALRRDIRVIPVLVQGAGMPTLQDLPEAINRLSRRNGIPLSDRRWNRDVAELIEKMEKILADRQEARSKAEQEEDQRRLLAVEAQRGREKELEQAHKKETERLLSEEARRFEEEKTFAREIGGTQAAPIVNQTSLPAASPTLPSWQNRFGAKAWIGLSAVALLVVIIAVAAIYSFSSDGNKNSNVGARSVPTPTAERTISLKIEPVLDVSLLGSPIRSPEDLVQVAFSPDGQWLASTGGKTVRLWRVGTAGESIDLQGTSLAGGGEQWLAVAFSPDGQMLAAGNDNGTLQIWRLRDNSPINQVSISGVGIVFRLGFTADSQTLFSAGMFTGNAKKVHLWRASDLSSLGDMTLEARKTIIAVNPDQRVVAINDPLNGVQLWSIENQSFLRQLGGDQKKALNGTFSADGDMLALSNTDGTVQLIDSANGRLIKTLTGPYGKILRVAISQDAKIVAGGWSNGTVQLWRVSDGAVIRSLTENTESVKSLAFSANSQVFASASKDKTIHVWRISEK